MRIEKIEESIALPEGVSAVFDEKTHRLTVTGKNGELSRVLFAPGVKLSVAGNEIGIEAHKATMREKKMLFTIKAHAKNMVKGTSEGFTYKLKICSGHFPMSVSVKGDTFEIKNFIGEKVPRVLKLKKGADVKVDGQDVTVVGVDKEIVGQVAADIEQLSRRVGFDNRIFQDGIFIVAKGDKVM